MPWQSPQGTALLLGHDLPGPFSHSCMNKKRASLFMVTRKTGKDLKYSLLAR